MKIGDKVRFLNEVGGGTITGFQGKDIVLVSDADGFELPTLLTDVVVIDTDDLNLLKKHVPQKKAKGTPAASDEAEASAPPAPTSIRQALNHINTDTEEEEDLTDKELTYQPAARERRGAEGLNLLLAFVPIDAENLNDTAYEAYLINDCNYYIRYTLLTQHEERCRLRHEGEIAPNTKVFVEEVSPEALDEWRSASLQLLAYKRDKAFAPKPALHSGLRIDVAKFYKAHSFRPNEYFDEPALLFPLITNDKPVRDLDINADTLQTALQGNSPTLRLAQPARHTADRDDAPHRRRPQTSGKADPRALIEVDLHADQLLDTMVGLEAADILDYQLKVFRETLDAHLKEHGRRIVFIHGKGDGTLRKAILQTLKRHYPQLHAQDASFREYGYGATLVTIR